MSFTSPIPLSDIAAIALAVVLVGCLGRSNLRTNEPGFRFVHMNQDGTVRELSRVEQAIFGQSYRPGDGAAPFIKARHDERNGWGSLSGFIDRKHVPTAMSIQPVDPAYSPTPINSEFLMRLHEGSGDRLTKTAGGFTVEPGSLDPKEALRRSTEFWLEHERSEDARARTKLH